MFVLIRSSYDEAKLEKLIQDAATSVKERGILIDLKYSTCFDISNGKILRSAVLIFKEHNKT